MAASIQEVAFELGGTLGIALLGSVMIAGFSHSLVVPATIPSAGSLVDGVDQLLAAAGRLQAGQWGELVMAAKDAFQAAFLWVAWSAAAFLLLLAGAIAWRALDKTSVVEIDD